MRPLAFIGIALALSACAARVAPPAAGGSPPNPAAASVPAGMQYLFGSGEGGAMALTVMHALLAYATDKAAHRPTDSVVLARGSPLVKATFVPCGDKPLAVVFDADETVIWNLGFEARVAAGEPYDAARWSRWERTGRNAVAAVAGAGHAMADLRKLGVTPVINTNRSAANADGTIATLEQAKLGAFRHGETLFLKGDGGPGTGKDARRAAIAARWCVIAMAGDQLGDFSDLFNLLPVAERRAIAVHGSAAGLWGKGWFLLPNPVYGTALEGGIDDVFPADKRWADPAEEKR